MVLRRANNYTIKKKGRNRINTRKDQWANDMEKCCRKGVAFDWARRRELLVAAGVLQGPLS